MGGSFARSFGPPLLAGTLLAGAVALAINFWPSEAAEPVRRAPDGGAAPTARGTPGSVAPPPAAREVPGVEPERSAASLPSAAERTGPKESRSLQGIAELLDGFPLADWSLELFGESAGEGGAGRPGAIRVRTDEHGRFHHGPAVEESYRVRDRSEHQMGTAPGSLAADGNVARVTFRAYRLRVRAVSAAGAPLADATVRFELTPDDPNLGPRLGTAFTRADGTAEWYAGPDGELAVLAVSERGTQTSAILRVRVQPGVSAETHTIVLFPEDLSATLALRVECQGTGQPVPFLVHLMDPRTGRSLGALRSEGASTEGVFPGLPVGDFELELGRRFIEPLGLYLETRRDPLPVRLERHGTTSVTVQVPCGGRLALLVTDPAWSPEEGPVPRVQAHLAQEEAQKALPVFSSDGENQIHVSMRFPIDQRVVSEPVLLPGDHELVLSGEGYHPVRLPIVIRPGELTELTVPLHRR